MQTISRVGDASYIVCFHTPPGGEIGWFQLIGSSQGQIAWTILTEGRAPRCRDGSKFRRLAGGLEEPEAGRHQSVALSRGRSDRNV
jgi:hypothetical protein